MTLYEFDVLYAFYQNKNIDMIALVEMTHHTTDEIEKTIEALRVKGYLANGLTKSGMEALDEYKVDNAIIMAAGMAFRSLPLSRIVPKGLFRVKGEILIERQIKQLREAGISEIIVVVGYMKEKFEYLREKYGVIIVENEDYYRYNNMSSLYAAQNYLKRSYICCSDNYFDVNVFRDHVYDSYYACKYSKDYANEYFVTGLDGEYITEIVKGGENGWYTIGEAFFSKKFSEIFTKYMDEEDGVTDARKLMMDDFHIRHIDELRFRLYKYADDMVQEFDTIEDVIAYDPSFAEYRDEVLDALEKESKRVPPLFSKYNEVKRYNSAETNQREGRLHLNENSFGPSPRCLDVLCEIKREDLYEYDMTKKDFLVGAISSYFNIPEDDIFVHNGSAEILKSVFAITLERGEKVLLPNPGWNYYASLVKENFCDFQLYDVTADDYSYYVEMKDLLKKADEYKPKIIVVNSPQNPTGCKMKGQDIERIAREYPESLVILDEAYWGFSDEDINVRRLVETYTNLIVSRTFSKYFGLANMRIGFGFCNFSVRHIFGLDLPLFRANPISRRMAAVALQDAEYYKKINYEVCRIREWFIDELNKLQGVRAFRSYANFVAVRFDGIDPDDLKANLAKQGIMIRLFKDNEETLARITISKCAEMQKALELITKYMRR